MLYWNQRLSIFTSLAASLNNNRCCIEIEPSDGVKAGGARLNNNRCCIEIITDSFNAHSSNYWTITDVVLKS